MRMNMSMSVPTKFAYSYMRKVRRWQAVSDPLSLVPIVPQEPKAFLLLCR